MKGMDEAEATQEGEAPPGEPISKPKRLGTPTRWGMGIVLLVFMSSCAASCGWETGNNLHLMFARKSDMSWWLISGPFKFPATERPPQIRYMPPPPPVVLPQPSASAAAE